MHIFFEDPKRVFGATHHQLKEEDEEEVLPFAAASRNSLHAGAVEPFLDWMLTRCPGSSQKCSMLLLIKCNKVKTFYTKIFGRHKPTILGSKGATVYAISQGSL